MTHEKEEPDPPDFSSAVERYHHLYAEGPTADTASSSVVARGVNRATIALTHELREYQRQIHEALFDMTVAVASELSDLRSELRTVQADVTRAGEAAAEARHEARLAGEANRSTADTATFFHRRTEDLEARVDVATALNDDLSRSLEDMAAELQALKDAMAAVVAQIGRGAAPPTERRRDDD